MVHTCSHNARTNCCHARILVCERSISYLVWDSVQCKYRSTTCCNSHSIELQLHAINFDRTRWLMANYISVWNVREDCVLSSWLHEPNVSDYIKRPVVLRRWYRLSSALDHTRLSLRNVQSIRTVVCDGNGIWRV